MHGSFTCFLVVFVVWVFFWTCHMACQILVLRPGIEPLPSAMEAQSPNHGLPGKSTACLLCGWIYFERSSATSSGGQFGAQR